MGITNCPKHEIGGLIEVCEHVDSLFTKGHYKEFRYIINMLWCDDCWEKYDLARFENLADMFDEGDSAEVIEPLLHDYESVYGEMHRQVWCDKCIDDIRASVEKDGEIDF